MIEPKMAQLRTYRLKAGIPGQMRGVLLVNGMVRLDHEGKTYLVDANALEEVPPPAPTVPDEPGPGVHGLRHPDGTEDIVMRHPGETAGPPWRTGDMQWVDWEDLWYDGSKLGDPGVEVVTYWEPGAPSLAEWQARVETYKRLAAPMDPVTLPLDLVDRDGWPLTVRQGKDDVAVITAKNRQGGALTVRRLTADQCRQAAAALLQLADASTVDLPALPAGLEFPGEDVAERLPDGGWVVRSGYAADVPTPLRGEPNCGDRIDEGPRHFGWRCSRHIGEWCVADTGRGGRVGAVWSKPNGGRP